MLSESLTPPSSAISSASFAAAIETGGTGFSSLFPLNSNYDIKVISIRQLPRITGISKSVIKK